MRLFVAILLPREIRDTLRRTVQALRAGGGRGRFVPDENYHLTLAFLGEVAHPRPVVEAMGRLSIPKMTLELDGLGHFPSGGGMLLYASLRPCASLGNLREDLVRALRKGGIFPDEKAFFPHITLARRCSIPEHERSFAEGSRRFAPEGISLMKSDFGQGGVAYEELFFIK